MVDWILEELVRRQSRFQGVRSSMNPSPSSSSLSSTLTSLNNLITLSNHVLSLTPSPPTLNSNLIQCPFNPHHLLPPPSLFLHHLCCPFSLHPLPNLNPSLTYPKTLHNSPSDQLFPYLDSLSNFFYHDCPFVFCVVLAFDPLRCDSGSGKDLVLYRSTSLFRSFFVSVSVSDPLTPSRF